MKALKEFFSIYISKVEIPLWGLLVIVLGAVFVLGGGLMLNVFFSDKPIEPAPVKGGVMVGVGIVLFLIGMWKLTLKEGRKKTTKEVTKT
jgi:multisubunit Na+/H+ antiporter MnhB subunit